MIGPVGAFVVTADKSVGGGPVTGDGAADTTSVGATFAIVTETSAGIGPLGPLGGMPAALNVSAKRPAVAGAADGPPGPGGIGCGNGPPGIPMLLVISIRA